MPSGGSDDLPDLSDLPDLGDPPEAGAAGDAGSLPLRTDAFPSPTRDHALCRRFTLRAVAGPDKGQTWLSSGDRLTIGTHRSSDVRLSDRTVSRFHCEIQLVGGRALVRDLESRNGTRVDGIEVLAAPLRAGAMLGVGGDQIRFELGDDHVRIPLSERAEFGLAVGRAPAMRAAFAQLERVAPTDTTVLLQGETGTGKDVLAESIHRQSLRARGSFVVVDCGAVPPGLLESELFGHEKGAFTGADRARAGAFEAAAGGTVFLDEIGELDVELQPKLLRCLEKKEIQRVGSATRTPVDFRVVAATSRNLRREVNAQRFRSDLYYRLAVVAILLPPLRDRKEDLALLSARLLAQLAPRDPDAATRLLTDDFVRQLARHQWPGNVRELRNYLERCLAMSDHVPPIIDGGAGADGGTGERGQPSVDTSLPIRAARERWLGHFERRYLEELLRRHDNNVTAAARAAGVNRMQLYRLLWRAGLR